VSKPEVSLSRACDEPEQPGGPGLVPRWGQFVTPKLGYNYQLCFNHASAAACCLGVQPSPSSTSDVAPAAPLRCQQKRTQHHKKFVLHCIVTDQPHSVRVFSLDIAPRAIVCSSMYYIQFSIARPRFTFGTSLPLAPHRDCE
jgi:hypothetical protein